MEAEGSAYSGEGRLILIDRDAPLRERIAVLARALAELEVEHVVMIPEAREVVEAMKGSRSGVRRPLA